MSELNDVQREQILNAIKTGRKIEAIKLYRESTGQGLKESKDFIEELTAHLLEENPNAITSSSAGCGTGMVLFCLTVGGTLWWQLA